MSVTIAMPRMSTDPELTAAQAKYPESLARAGAEMRWIELDDTAALYLPVANLKIRR